MTVPLSSCGTQTVESSSDRLMIENTIVIQADAMVQDSWDSARKITCDWQSKLEKMVTFAPFGVADLLQVAEVKFAGSGDNVRTRMEIQFGRGPFAAPLDGLTKIGDELTVVVYAEDGGAGYATGGSAGGSDHKASEIMGGNETTTTRPIRTTFSRVSALAGPSGAIQDHDKSCGEIWKGV